jgi:hypothetical protein
MMKVCARPSIVRTRHCMRARSGWLYILRVYCCARWIDDKYLAYLQYERRATTRFTRPDDQIDQPTCVYSSKSKYKNTLLPGISVVLSTNLSDVPEHTCKI